MTGIITTMLIIITTLFFTSIGLDILEENLTLKTWFTGIGTVIVFLLRITL